MSVRSKILPVIFVIFIIVLYFLIVLSNKKGYMNTHTHTNTSHI